jgi:ubiquinone/menaquinone biosynthesis C-methylase UbiE
MNKSVDWHKDQIAYWQFYGGARWAAAQARTDQMLAPVSQALLEHARPEQGMATLEIGCGCGALTAALAEKVGPSGRVLGVDISEEMLALAQERLSAYPQAGVLLADAAAYPFTPFADLVVSQFGVMFFGDPVQAFSNIRNGTKPDGRLIFACWRPIKENPWAQVPLHAAYTAGAPRAARPEPDQPGPFSFADPSRVTSILSEAGFREPSLSPANMTLDIATGQGLEAAVQQVMTIGPAAATLREQPDGVRAAAAHAIEEALQPYLQGTSVYLAAAIWLVQAKAVED